MAKKHKNIFSNITSKFFWLLSIIVIIFVLLLSLVKLTIPYFLNDSKKIEQFLEQKLGGDLSFKGLSVDWTKFDPIIKVNGLNWSDSKNITKIKLVEGEIELAFWKTLYHGYIKTENISVAGLDIQLNTEKLETTSKANFSIEQVKRFLDLHPEVLEQRQIDIKNAQLTLATNSTTNSERQYLFKFPLISFEKIAEQRQLLIETTSELYQKGRLVVETHRQPFGENSETSIFMKFDNVDVESLEANDSELEKSGIIDSLNYQAWIDFQEDKISKSRIELLANSREVELPVLDTIINLERHTKGISVFAEKFDLIQTEDDIQKVTSSSFELQTESITNSETLLKANAEDIPIQYLANLSLPLLPSGLQKIVIDNKPKGDIASVSLNVKKADEKIIPISVLVGIDNLSLNASENIPAIGIDKITIVKAPDAIDSNQWKYKIQTASNKLNWPHVFNQTIDIQDMLIAGRFEISNDFKLNIDNFEFSNNDATAKANGFVLVDENNKAELSLYAEGYNINVSQLAKYWPRNVMPKSALGFLDKSLKAGRVDFAKMVWRGGVKDFPYTDHSGQFNTQAWVKNAEFKFDDEWPQGENLTAHATFDNDSMLIKATEGYLVGNRVLQAQAEISSFSAENTLLKINGRATATTDSFRNIYNKSPLSEWLGDHLLAISFEPALTTHLELQIPLSKASNTKVNGSINFKNHQIKGISENIELSETNGQLVYSEKGAYSKNLSANLWGSLVNFDLKAADYTKGSGALTVNAQSNFSMATAEQFNDFNLPINITGNSDVKVNFVLAEDNSESIIIQTNLVGSNIEGPKWLSKDFEEHAPVLVTLFKSDKKAELNAVYRDSINTKLQIDPITFQPINGTIALGNKANSNPVRPANGVAIIGGFDKIDIGEWIDSLQFKNNDKFSWPSWIESVDITAPLLDFAGQQLHQVQFRDEKIDGDGIKFYLTTQEAQAHLTLKPNGLKQLFVEKLDLELSEFEKVSEQKLELNKSTFYNWDIECRECRINGFDTGLLKITTHNVNEAVVVRGQSDIPELLNAVINGSWENDQTQFTINFKTTDAGKLFQHWGYGDGLGDAETEGQIELDWTGGFHDVAINKLNGTLKLEAGEGVVRELSDKQARIFSLLSLQTLRRRLSLDFSDLFGEGFFFDEINADFTLTNGVAKSNHVKITGPAADVEMSGYTNFNDKTLHQKVLVTPKISSSLPILAGWAIEPTTGLIMFILNKIFEPVIDVVVSIEYQITGDIADPQVVELDKKSKEIPVPEEMLQQMEQDNSQQQEETLPEDVLQEGVLQKEVPIEQ